MTALTVTAAQVSVNDIERGAIVRWYQTGESMTPGQAVYLDSNNLVWKAKSDSSAHASAIGVVALADNFSGETTIQSGGMAGVCIYGPMNGFASMSQGQVGWVGATAGQIVDTAPTGGAYQMQVGHAVDDQTFFVDPGTASPVSHS